MTINCADAITLITENLMVPVERLYTLYNAMTGDSLFTHQLPRAFRACEPAARAAFPRLTEFTDANPITTENYRDVLRKAIMVCGDAFEIEPLADWVVRDPIEEAQAMAPGRVVVVSEA
jgi:hypothetical protein